MQYNSHMITRVCVRDGCGVEFSGTKSKIGRKKYCSRSCAAKVNNAIVKKRSVEGSCKSCGTEISTRYVYCSAECRGWEFGLGTTGRIQPVYNYTPNCEVCGGVKTGSRGRRYCSQECRTEARNRLKDESRRTKVERWLRGEIDACLSYSLAEWARKYVLEQAGYRCEAIDTRTGERCTEDRRRENGSTVLQIDHIDGNWQNCVRENLRALCPTCHALTPTWGAANMGRGRTWKSEYNQYQKK